MKILGYFCLIPLLALCGAMDHLMITVIGVRHPSQQMLLHGLWGLIYLVFAYCLVRVVYQMD